MLSPSTTSFLRAGIVGAGTMGAGIAVAFANAGMPITVVDTAPRALQGVRASFERRFADRTPPRLRLSEDIAALSDSDVVIEAVFEDLALKREVFARLGAICRSDAFLATNTSTLDIDAIVAQAPHPERLLGMHFFSPAHVMRLVEIIPGARTSPETLTFARALAQALGKIGVIVGNADGFVGNRMLRRYRHEAERLLEEGAAPHQIDAALIRFGFAMGPFAVSDLAGLDIAYRAKREREARGACPDVRQSRIPDLLVEMGRLGQKSGAGYYRYEAGQKTPYPDPIVEDTIARERERLGIAPRRIEDAEIVDRCLAALADEGAKALTEGVARSAADIDTIWVHGYGFPAARGGPMAYAAIQSTDR